MLQKGHMRYILLINLINEKIDDKDKRDFYRDQ